jgi:hypothetical protein
VAPSSADFLNLRVDPVLTQKVGDPINVSLQARLFTPVANIFGTTLNAESGSGSGFSYSGGLTAQVRINGVAQPVVPITGNQTIVYSLFVGDTIGLKVNGSLNLQSSSASAGSPSNTTFNVTHDGFAELELDGTPGVSLANPVFASTVLGNGTRQFPGLRIARDQANQLTRAWVATPTSPTWYYEVPNDGPAIASLQLPFAGGDVDGYTVARLVNGTWQNLGTVTGGTGVTMPSGTFAIRISDIEWTGSNFPLGLTASSSSESLLISASTSPIPEPATAGLLGMGALGMLARRSRRRT